jgi:hypothetical protein
MGLAMTNRILIGVAILGILCIYASVWVGGQSLSDKLAITGMYTFLLGIGSLLTFFINKGKS